MRGVYLYKHDIKHERSVNLFFLDNHGELDIGCYFYFRTIRYCLSSWSSDSSKFNNLKSHQPKINKRTYIIIYQWATRSFLGNKPPARVSVAPFLWPIVLRSPSHNRREQIGTASRNHLQTAHYIAADLDSIRNSKSEQPEREKPWSRKNKVDQGLLLKESSQSTTILFWESRRKSRGDRYRSWCARHHWRQIWVYKFVTTNMNMWNWLGIESFYLEVTPQCIRSLFIA